MADLQRGSVVRQLQADISLLSHQFQLIVSTLGRVVQNLAKVQMSETEYRASSTLNSTLKKSEVSKGKEFKKANKSDPKKSSFKVKGFAEQSSPHQTLSVSDDSLMRDNTNTGHGLSLDIKNSTEDANHLQDIKLDMDTKVPVSFLTGPISLSPLDSPSSVGSQIISKDHTSRAFIEEMKNKRFKRAARRFSCPSRSMMATKKLASPRIDRRIKINVGGILFVTSYSTLTREVSMFSGMLSGRFKKSCDADGCYFVDRDSTYFNYILNYMRDGRVHVDELTLLQAKAMLQEAEFYQLEGLISLLRRHIRQTIVRMKAEMTNEKEYKILFDVKPQEVAQVFKNMTTNDGYDFENWMWIPPAFSGRTAHHRIHLVFSKKLSRGEIMLLDRLTSSF